MVEVVDRGPHFSVVKKIVCSECGSTLAYVPRDIKSKIVYEIGGTDMMHYIECPECTHTIYVSRYQ